MSKSIAKLVCFGRGGDQVIGSDFICSGYGSPDNPHAARSDGSTTFPDGTYAIDKRAAVETPEGFSWVFTGPMCDPDLPDDACDHCPVPSELFASAVTADPSNQYGKLLALHSAQNATGRQRGALDHVSVAEYVRGWREHGARIGQYRDGVIVWEN